MADIGITINMNPTQSAFALSRAWEAGRGDGADASKRQEKSEKVRKQEADGGPAEIGRAPKASS